MTFDLFSVAEALRLVSDETNAFVLDRIGDRLLNRLFGIA